ncbi:MAG: MBOAT family protein [Lachnospiraceae bacterium]|nr:MBOAT family protein [Lachnospiraceae bacterium]
MQFNSIDFLIFFPIVVLVYFFIPRRARYLWLLAASYYFHMSWNARYALLIAASTLITWVSGLLIPRFPSKAARKSVVAVSFAGNLGILFFFKYFDFLLENVNLVLARFHLQMVENPFDILLPVGISFYTFQALSYTMDVYRGEVEPEKNPLKYALFVSFFPQLVAGPIERSKNLLRQVKNVENLRLWDYDRIASGFILMCWGMFQKVVIADRLAIFVDQVWENLSSCGSVETIAAALAFSLEIYCDFAGYSSIAIGAARLMGFDLMENFNAPYFAASIRQFWRRWHISLSGWFRDYLYIPLGGNRKGRVRQQVNVMITFLLSGLWHGADWTYVIWGGLHGGYQVIGDLTRPLREKINGLLHTDTKAESYRLGQMLFTFLLVTFAWIFFRAEDLEQALYFLNRLFTRWNPWNFFNGSLYEFGLDRMECHILLAGLVLLFFVDLVRERKKEDLGNFLLRQNLWFRWAVVIGLILGCLVYGVYGVDFDSTQFIYFTF